MAHALILTASSSGRTSLPSDAGFALEVDGDTPVTLDVWPYPAAWIPDDVRLYRGGLEIADSPGGDGLRWVLSGDDRFGEFTALAIAAGRAVTSPILLVRPAGAVPAAVPGTLGAIAGRGGAAAGTAPGAPAPGASAPGVPPAPGRAAPIPHPISPADTSTASPTVDASTRAFPPDAHVASDRLIDLSTGSGYLPGHAPTTADRQGSGTDPAFAPPQHGHPAHAADATHLTSSGRLPAHASPADLRAVAEVPAGEYDGRFAAWVGAVFAVLALGFAGIVISRLLIDVDLPAAQPADPATTVVSHDGTVAERVGLATSVLMIALGGVLLLAGTALGALEVRGRQRRAPSVATTWRTQEPGLRFLPAMLDRVNQIPSVVAVLVVGGIVLGLGLIGTLYWPTLF